MERSRKRSAKLVGRKADFDFNASHHLQTIGVVGTRKITSYGHDVTEMITRDMVVSGYVIVSGLAMGVDATAHKTTIENHGKTVAVLGCGVDCCSPSENTALYDRIIVTGGAIVSEYPLGQSPTKGSFPSRNRIIAGLSQAVVVTEGAADSGALYTADDAFANNRPVFAIPGPITSSLSKGPNSLLVKGAKLVTSGEDILRALGITNQELRKRNREIKGETGDEQVILDLLQNESLHFDELVKQSNKSSTDVAVLLSMMELKGMVKSLENGMFSLDL